MRIAVLALDGVFDTGLATVLDTFATANELAGLTDSVIPAFEVVVVGLQTPMPRPVHSGLGLRVPVCDQATMLAPDWVIVPALSAKAPQALIPALAGNDVRHALPMLRRWSAGGARIAAACTGTFVLAQSGLLDGHEATTTWWLAPLFRERYPGVRLDAHRIVVASGATLTAGAALSHIDLALWLIRQRSPELAALVARYLVFDTRPSQSAYVIADHLSHADPLVQKFDRWVRERLGSPLTLDAAAQALATSKRTLSRRLHQVLGKTPFAYIQDLRIEQAVHLLRTTRLSVDRIAEQVGYADGVSLRTLLRKRLGKGIRELRIPLDR
ncbi:GlxA family transcriptional regulator [Cupriavidus necator]